MRFGEYIRIKREENSWTQPEAAAKISVEQSYLSKLETGKSYPSEEVFAKIMSAYSIDVSQMNRDLFSAEIDKLREIGEVRTALLTKQKNERRFMQGWLIAGLVMLMISGASFGLTFALNGPPHLLHLYKSEGVIKAGESPMIFNFLSVGQQDENGQGLMDRVDYKFKELNTYRGNSFIDKLESGYRIYSHYETKEIQGDAARLWLFPPALMFLFGAIACFYISRRWQ
ncbi:helix-turn-helix domain-containing protein [Kordiimonas laminariae]|uniref:helix-turn-helix domain-containing protein n=1 Tax=Kordiimonas laminariae TaxID=2917717 RepID=UPI001FF29ABC|nr:helix-turn-helix transcriptional regulator [Kordiimonas laminariae]MCK0070235.1 helix-turn-helix domain-containing protein [Kordiimonas laminariae]